MTSLAFLTDANAINIQTVEMLSNLSSAIYMPPTKGSSVHNVTNVCCWRTSNKCITSNDLYV